MRVPIRLTPLISFVALAALLMPARLARATAEAVITVDTTNDELPVPVANGHCSLREAIRATNMNTAVDSCPAGGSGTDTLILPAGFYQLSLAGADENNALTGDLDILGSLVIQGAGRDSSVIDGNDIDRVFHITAGVSVEISHLTIQNGSAIIGWLGGGGILNQGTLTLKDVSVQNNYADVVGGGMDNYVGTATIINSSISGNTSTEDGGGVFNDGRLSVSNSILSGNTAVNNGGALDNRDSADLSDVTISGNTSSIDGGGIFNDGELFLSSVTLNGNTASNTGGGLENWGSTTIENVTISGNTAIAGGGLFNESELFVRNTTIIANTATAATDDNGGNIQNKSSIRMKTSIVAYSLAGPNCSGIKSVVSEGYNLENTNTCSFISATDLRDVGDVVIGSLADNGGPTLTHALLQGSPAIDAGNNSSCLTKDQRGAFRPADGNGDGNAICDIGAFEYEGVFPKLVFVPFVDR